VIVGEPVATPVQVRATVWGEPDALSFTFRVAEKLAALAGVQVTKMLHVFPGVTVNPLHPSEEMAKSEGFVPERVAALITRLALPEFCTFTLEAADVTPTLILPKAMEVGDRVTAGAVPPKLEVHDVPFHCLQ